MQTVLTVCDWPGLKCVIQLKYTTVVLPLSQSTPKEHTAVCEHQGCCSDLHESAIINTHSKCQGRFLESTTNTYIALMKVQESLWHEQCT